MAVRAIGGALWNATRATARCCGMYPMSALFARQMAVNLFRAGNAVSLVRWQRPGHLNDLPPKKKGTPMGCPESQLIVGCYLP